MWVLKRRNLGWLSVLHIRQDSTERHFLYTADLFAYLCICAYRVLWKVRLHSGGQVRVGVGRVGRESKLQIPMPYPVRWDRTSALPQYSHCSTPVCPRTALVPGLPVLPSTAQGSAVLTGPISCHTVGQSQGLGWSWPSWFGLDSVSRSTGPALVLGAVTPRLPFYCHSSLSSRLSSESYMQRHGALHLFSHEEMVVMAAAWPGSGLACAWCRRACRAVLPASPQNSSLSFHGEGM